MIKKELCDNQALIRQKCIENRLINLYINEKFPLYFTPYYTG